MENFANRRASVGRRAQLDELIARRKAAAAGRGSVVFVYGEAGCGKTWLLEKFAAALTRDRTLWLSPVRPPAREGSELRSAVEMRSKRSTVIFVDDAHRAPLEFLEELIEVGKSATGSRLLLVVTYRRADLELNPPALMLLAKLARLESAGSLEIGPLDRVEIAALVRGLLDDGITLSAATMEHLERRSGGNPMLLQHLVAAAQKHPDGADAAELPLAISGIIAEWLAPLSKAERNALRFAALMRSKFGAQDVATVAGLSVPSVAATLRRASELDLLVEQRDLSAPYHFRHLVVAEALERTFLPHEARELHGRIALAIESSNTTDQHTPALAQHWQAAGDGKAAAHYAERAGDRAFTLREYENAALWYERAIEMIRVGGFPAHNLYEKLADSLARSGFASDSHEALRAAAHFSDIAGESDRAVRLRIHDAMSAQFQCDLSAGFARVRSAVKNGVGERSLHYAQAVAASLLALRHDTERAWDMLAGFPHDDGSVESAALVKYWEVIGYIALQHSDPHTARDAYGRALAAAQDAGDTALITEVEADFALYELQFGLPTCAERMQRAIVLAQEHGLPAVEAYVRGYAALDDFVRGRLHASREHLRGTLVLADQTPAALVARTYAGLSTAGALCDDALLAACAQPELLQLAFRSGSPSFFGRAAGPYAQWLIDAGRLDEGRAILHRCVGALRNVYGTFLTMPVVAMYADQADVAVARASLGAAAENANDRIAAATLKLFDAIVERRAGDHAASRATAAEAAQHYGSLGWTGMQAWALELGARHAEALELYQRCGNLRGIRRIELSQSDETSETGRNARALSERERNVIELVAQGKSNRAIATSLSVSEKTVEAHLTAIFEKLGFRSRTELAGAATSHRLSH